MADLKRWEDMSLRLGYAEPELSLSVLGLRANTCKDQLAQAAIAARYAASKTAEPGKALALTLAEELEQYAASEAEHCRVASVEL
jgi:hypothetical protein